MNGFWQWISLMLVLLVHTAMLFRWGGRVTERQNGHDRELKEGKEAHNTLKQDVAREIAALRDTDISQSQVLAVSTRLLDVHADEIKRIRDWRHDDYAQWAQRIEARLGALELDRKIHNQGD